MRAWPVERACLCAALVILVFVCPALAGEENPLAAKPYGAQKRSVYHTYECGTGRLIADKNRITFDSVDEAEKSGRRLCGFCRHIAEKRGHPIRNGSNGQEDDAAAAKPKESEGGSTASKPTGKGSTRKTKNAKVAKPPASPPADESGDPGSGSADDPPPDVSSGRLAKLLPGGTIILDSGQRMRLLGVAFPLAGQALAEDALRFAEEQMRDRTLYFAYSRFAPSPEHRDQLGRLLAYVKPDKDGRDLAGELLFQGYVALDRTIAFDRHAEYERRESDAFAAKRGLWKPLEGRAGRTRVLIGDHAVFYHPEGCPHTECLTDPKDVTINQAKARRLSPCSEFRGPP